MSSSSASIGSPSRSALWRRAGSRFGFAPFAFGFGFPRRLDHARDPRGPRPAVARLRPGGRELDRDVGRDPQPARPGRPVVGEGSQPLGAFDGRPRLVVEHRDHSALAVDLQHGAHEAPAGHAVPAAGDDEPPVGDVEAVERELDPRVVRSASGRHGVHGTRVLRFQAVPDYRHDLQFGAFIVPVARQADAWGELSRLADVAGLDIVSFQDHPYQSAFLDTWTLLSVVAAATTNVRVAPNVANLPLRPPVVLARSAASLDILSGGRVELGLGAGTYHDALVALGLPRLTAGQSVDALAEAVDVIRAIWAAEGPVHYDGTHFQLDGAESGPPPAHDIEIWLGAYKPRMLRLTGAKADGWLPSLGYIELDQLPEANARIDAAAEQAGCPPEAIRRMLNINSSLGAEQLAELTLSTGMSAYILMVLRRRPAALRRGGRARHARARRGGARQARRGGARRPRRVRIAGAAGDRPDPGPERRLSDETAWDESTRHRPRPRPVTQLQRPRAGGRPPPDRRP